MEGTEAFALRARGRLLVPEAEAARLLGLSLSTFRRDFLGKGHLRPVRLPGGTRRNLYSVAAIEKLVADAADAS